MHPGIRFEIGCEVNGYCYTFEKKACNQLNRLLKHIWKTCEEIQFTIIHIDLLEVSWLFVTEGPFSYGKQGVACKQKVF